MMLVIDKSGSMGGEKIEMAKEAARAAVELLGPSDKVGVLAFEGENFWVSEMHPCTDKGFVLDRIASARGRRRHRDGPGDGRSARDAAVDRRQAQARDHPDRRHLGARRLRGDRPGDDRRPDHRARPSRWAADADQSLLEEIARLGNGRYYVADDPGQVPQIFAKETVTASKSAINEQPFPPTVVRPTQVLSEIRLDEAPFLLGYVVTRPKPTAEVILATESGDPLLAWWRYGLGMTRGVHLRRQGPLGRRVAHLAPVRPVLGPGRPPRPPQGRGQGNVRSDRAQRPEGRRLARRDRALRPVSQPGRDRADAGRPAALRPGRSRWPRWRRGATRPSST